MAKYFINPFGDDGDRTTIPETPPIDGSVSYESGFGIDYQLDPTTDGLNIPRNQFNELMYQMSLAIQQYQQLGFPDFISSTDNGGTAYSYAQNATVRSGGVNYYSLINGNTDTPPSSNWGLVQYAVPETTGICKEFYGLTLPLGYVWANGTTIGNAASGATGRANADTINLFTLLWNSISNTNLPLQDSTGAPISRGISAAADYAANCRIPTIDKRGKVSVGKTDMGGTTDNGLITIAGCGISGSTLAAVGGIQTVSLTSDQNGSHTHSIAIDNAGSHSHTGYVWGGSGEQTTPNGQTANAQSATNYNQKPATIDPSGIHTHTATINTSGSGLAHQNVQPSIICNYILKL